MITASFRFSTHKLARCDVCNRRLTIENLSKSHYMQPFIMRLFLFNHAILTRRQFKIHSTQNRKWEKKNKCMTENINCSTISCYLTRKTTPRWMKNKLICGNTKNFAQRTTFTKNVIKKKARIKKKKFQRTNTKKKRKKNTYMEEMWSQTANRIFRNICCQCIQCGPKGKNAKLTVSVCYPCWYTPSKHL